VGAKTITAKVLECLFNTLEDFAELAISKKAAYRHLSVFDKEYEWTETKLGKWVESLKREGYIEFKEISGKRSIEFTDKGRIKIVELIASKIPCDGLNRFVSFDIPNDLRNQRDGFRKAIKKMGFRQLQQSLWVINKDVGDLVQIAEYEFGVEKYSAYIVSNHSDVDGVIKKILSN